jgi:hypothetical protein
VARRGAHDSTSTAAGRRVDHHVPTVRKDPLDLRGQVPVAVPFDGWIGDDAQRSSRQLAF